MAETNQENDLSVTEQRIMSIHLPEFVFNRVPRVCLRQIACAEVSTEDGEAKVKEVLDAFYWDYEDYDEDIQGARPEGADPSADVQVCSLGGCTLRVFQSLENGTIETGKCRAAGYCLSEKFEAIGTSATTEEGRALYNDIIDTCDGFTSSTAVGEFCPRLDCNVSAGLSEDMCPGTSGTCPIRNQLKLEGFQD